MNKKKMMAEEAVLTKGQEVNPKVGMDRECVVSKILAAMVEKQRACAKSDEGLRATAKSDEGQEVNVEVRERQTDVETDGLTRAVIEYAEERQGDNAHSDDERQVAEEVIISHDALRERMEEVMGRPFEEQKGTLYRYRINGGECVEQFIPFTTRTTEGPLYTTLYETNDERGRVKVRVYESPSRVYFRVDCTKKLGWEHLREVVYGDECKRYLDECCAKVSGVAVETPSRVVMANTKCDGRVWA